METSINDTTDSGVNAIVETIIATLQGADAKGLRFLPANRLFHAEYGDTFQVALKTAKAAGRIATRRARTGNHKRRRYVALPHNERYLPGGAR